MTKKSESFQQQVDDETLDANVDAATGELSDAQLERVAAGTSAQCRAPLSDGLKNSRT